VPLGDLTSGATFGEIALLNDHGLRTCNVEADGYVDMASLSSVDFHSLLDTFSDLREEMLNIASRRHDQTVKMQMALHTADDKQLASAAGFSELTHSNTRTDIYNKKKGKKEDAKSTFEQRFDEIIDVAHGLVPQKRIAQRGVVIGQQLTKQFVRMGTSLNLSHKKTSLGGKPPRDKKDDKEDKARRL